MNIKKKFREQKRHWKMRKKQQSLLAGEYYKNKNGKGKCEPAKSQS